MMKNFNALPCIKLLSKQVSDKIAAGEVAERPVSVVKELVENSIDAGCSKVVVEIKNGGIVYIRVTDDGSGIPREQVKTAFLRHATSKLSEVDDLYNITTMGFRGEALSSIAAVSDVEMITKTKNSEIGTAVHLLAGSVVALKEAAGLDGTTIIVRNLFKNVPARMKFLKRDSTEAKYIEDLIRRLALCNPNIAFKYISDEKLLLSTAGNSRLDKVITSVYGEGIVGKLLSINYQKDGIEVSGQIGMPSIARRNRNWQTLFVNGRCVKNSVVSKIVEEAYKESIMSGKFPFFVLNIDVHPSQVDVNVHPSKIEVKFANEKQVYDAVYNAVSNVLTSTLVVPNPLEDIENVKILEKRCLSSPKNELDASESLINNQVQDKMRLESIKINAKLSQMDRQLPSPDAQASQVNMQLISTETQSQKPVITPIKFNDEKATMNDSPIEIIGSLFATYIIVEQNDKMYVIDQHAAHERIKYEELLKNYNNKLLGQALLIPEVVGLSAHEFKIVIDNLEFFAEVGFEIEDFGNSCILVNKTPFSVKIETNGVADIILELVEILEFGRPEKKLDKIERALYKIACREAIKANDNLTRHEMQALVNSIEKLGNINYCPHGRPLKIYFDKKDIEKFFKRIV